MTSLTKTMDAKYGLQGIEDMVPSLWSLIKVAYNRYALLGVIYLDKLERNRLMCSHELYKFSDSTLISVRDKLKDMAKNLEMRLLRSLEKFIGGREYGEDLRLLQRTI
ncbi:hypothetical protein Tco_1039342 [Tanacetum coccineum]